MCVCLEGINGWFSSNTKRSGGRKTEMEGRGKSEKENGIEGF